MYWHLVMLMVDMAQEIVDYQYWVVLVASLEKSEVVHRMVKPWVVGRRKVFA